MQRDMDVIRTVMLRLEAVQIPAGGMCHITGDAVELRIEGHTPDEVEHHLRLIKGAGFLDLTPTQIAPGVIFRGLSWRGHDFLDSVRDPEIWRETKEGAKKAGGFSIDLIVALAKGLIKKKIEEHTGVKLDF